MHLSEYYLINQEIKISVFTLMSQIVLSVTATRCLKISLQENYLLNHYGQKKGYFYRSDP
jgi:hypothetical protein